MPSIYSKYFMKLYEKPFRMIVPNVKKRADRKTGEKNTHITITSNG